MIAHVLPQHRDHVLASLLAHAQHRSRRLGDVAIGRHRSQIHEPYPGGERLQEAFGQLDRETRLPAPANSGDRQQARLIEQPSTFGQLPLSTDEARALARQVVAHAHGIRRGGRRRCHGDGRHGLREASRGRVTVGWRLGEAARERRGHAGRHGRSQVGYRPGLNREMLVGEALARAHEGRHAGQHLVEHAGERVQVGASVDLDAAEGLLGGHVGRGPESGSHRRRSRLRAPQRPGDAEVSNQGEPVREQDVLGLDVAMDDAALVRVAERARHLARQPKRFLERQLSLAFEALA